MPVLVRVATRTVEGHLFRSDERVACFFARAVFVDPAEQLAASLFLFTVVGAFV